MTNVGLLRRMRLLALLGPLSIAACGDGCGGGATTSGTEISAASSSTSSSSSGEGGSGGGSSSSGSGGDGGTPIFGGTVQEVASGAEFQSPYDATPDLKGNEIYFTAVDPALAPGVFRVIADGSAKAEPLRVGAPFVTPTGIAMSTDGTRLIIADPGWDTKTPIPGAIASMAREGGAPAAIAGTEGLAPQTLDIIEEGGEDVIYFTGIGAGGPAVFKVDLDGGVAEEIFKATAAIPLDTVSGISVSTDGSLVYVVNVDTVGQGSVIEIKDGAGSVLAGGLSVGNPGGAALKRDASEVFISTRDSITKKSSVLQINVTTKKLGALTDVISDYNEPAGLHRAHKADVFAFVDNQAKGTGAIFVLR